MNLMGKLASTFGSQDENRGQPIALGALKRNFLQAERPFLLLQVQSHKAEVERSLVEVPVIQNVLHLKTVLQKKKGCYLSSQVCSN